MLSKEQDEIINKRIEKEVTEFLSGDYTIVELSKVVNVPSSTIQRDLTNIARLKGIYKDNFDRVSNLINNKLRINKLEGLKEGGINSTTVNEPIRDDLGHFIGNKRK